MDSRQRTVAFATSGSSLAARLHPAAAAAFIFFFTCCVGYASALSVQYPHAVLKTLKSYQRLATDNFTQELMRELIDAPTNIANARGRYVCQLSKHSSSVALHTISFSLPARNFRTAVPSKAKYFSVVIPGDSKTYKFKPKSNATAQEVLLAEVLYNEDMARSMFAITRKKSGWDCLRHVEILAAGSLPLFTNIDEVPAGTMAAHPVGVYKTMIRWPGLVLNGFPGQEPRLPRVLNFTTPVNITTYQVAAEALVQLARATLTTEAMARYLLDTIGAKTTHKILFLTRHTDWRLDYLGDNMFHGLKTTMLDNLVEFPARTQMYQSSDTFLEDKLVQQKARAYGNGFGGFLFSLPSAYRTDLTHSTVAEAIANKVYDFVIFGLAFRELPFFHEVCSTYDRSRVVFLHGDDDPPTEDQMRCYSSCSDYIFTREMARNCSRDDQVPQPQPDTEHNDWPDACPVHAPADNATTRAMYAEKVKSVRQRWLKLRQAQAAVSSKPDVAGAAA